MKKSGFTLIELSIVLIIIGLIIGGVLVGQDLIKASEIRATIAQIEKYDTAVNTFKIKYGYIPGDMPPATAGELEFFQLAACTTLCRYNNNIIDSSIAAGGAPIEEFVFWRHLSDAKLVDGNYGNNAAYPLDNYGGLTPYPDDWPTFLTPQTKMKGYFLEIYQARRYTTAGIGSNKAFNDYMFQKNDGSDLSISLVYAIDNKMNDGYPNTGRVVIHPLTGWATSATSGNCTYSSTTRYKTDVLYNRAYANDANSDVCSFALYIKQGF